MVKQFNTASSGDNKIPDTINSNGLASNSYEHTVPLASDMDVETSQPANSKREDNPMTYVPAQKSSSYQKASWWGRLNLGKKATILAIALGVIPAVGIGVTGTFVAEQVLEQQIIKDNQAKAFKVEEIVDNFLSERYENINALAALPIFTDPDLRSSATEVLKKQALNQYLEIYKVYDSIALFDTNGNVIAQSDGPALPNNKDFGYFQTVLETGRPVISQPEITSVGQEVNLYNAAPIKDSATGNIIAIVRTRMPASVLTNLMANVALPGDTYSLVDASGNIFAAMDNSEEGQAFDTKFPELAPLRSLEEAQTLVTRSQKTSEAILVTHQPLSLENTEITPALNWGLTLTTSKAQALEPQRQLTLLLLMAIGVTTVLAGGVATLLVKRAITPILEATKAVKKLSQGELDTRLPVEGEDEFAVLGSSINRMADQVQTLLQEQKVSLEQLQNYADTVNAASRGDRQFLFEQAVKKAKEQLHADRVVIYGFEPDLSGSIVAEAVAPGWPRALADRISDPCIPGKLLKEYKQGRIVPTSDVHATNYSQAHMQLLERLGVKANLVVPIISADNLLGLMVAHQCSETRVWQQSEIEFLKQLANQVGLALTGVSLAAQKASDAERAEQLNEIISRIRKSLKTEEIYEAALTGIRETLKTDRAIVYLFDENWQGTIVAESVGGGWPQSVGANIADPCFAEEYVEKYKRGRVKAVENIYDAGLTKCYLGQLEPFKVKANLVAPILASNKLIGLLVTHQCSSTRPWQEGEINFFKQVAIQVGFALDQAALLEQQEQARIEAEVISQEQRRQKEALQLQLLELLSDVEGAARGDLTVRADVTTGEIGTVADFFNAVIESLRGIVTKVKTAATQVNTSLGENEGAIRQLSEEALKQAEETTHTLDSVERMTRSIQDVAENARQAAAVARTASTTAETGGLAIDRSVQNILSLRETVAETAKKVKRLGESSQQISKVVSLINQIALQTNLLAINAGIEAARAGEEGQGFAVVAEEVGELAARSAAATKEIEQIVENIQQGTTEVVEAMELGTAQVVEGTHLVEDAKQSLSQILEVSRQIDQLVQSISTATVSQAETSQAVTELMKEMAKVSERTSDSTRHVSLSLQETVGVAQELEASVSTFKVGTEA